MIQLSIRYLLARRMQTSLTLLGIFFAATAYIAMSGFFIGFQRYLVDQLVSNSAHVHIEPREDFLGDHSLDHAFFGEKYLHSFWSTPPSGRKDNAKVEMPQKWYARLNADRRVVAYSPQLTAQVVFAKSNYTYSGSLIGCDPTTQVKVTNIADFMTVGSFSELSVGGNRIIAGSELLKKIGASVNQTMVISVGSGEPVPFKIVGSFSTGTKNTDLQGYANLSDVQKLNQTPNQVNEIAVKLTDYNEASQIAADWSKLAPEKIESWDEQNASFLSIFVLQNAMRYMMISTILIVAGFGIYNVLNMTVSQKKRDIAILKSMGYGNGEIVFLFFSQGLILGVIGSFLGMIAGYCICLYLQTIPFSGGPVGGRPSTLHIALEIPIFVQAVALGLISSSVAAILPARSAGKLTPIEIIRAGTE